MTLLSTYNNCKKLIASNLNKQEVEASAEEGLTTLANKILLINNCNKKSKSKLIIRYTIDIPEELQNEVNLGLFHFILLGPTISTRISSTNFKNNEYIQEDIPNGRYGIYCNILSYNNPPLKSDSILFNRGILTDDNDLILTIHIKY